MCYRPEKPYKDYPRYDDIWNIDSASVAPRPDAPHGVEPRVDPAATAYTEKYCEKS